MARALRIQCPGDRYHVTARGNARGEIFWDDTDRFRFLELLSQLGQRFFSPAPISKSRSKIEDN